jgi:hypothetical protein
MLRDIDYLIGKLDKIDGFRDVGDYLASIIKAKQIKSAEPPPAAPTADGEAPTAPEPPSDTKDEQPIKEEPSAEAAKGTEEEVKA